MSIGSSRTSSSTFSSPSLFKPDYKNRVTEFICGEIMAYVEWFAKLLKGIGGVSLIGMMLLTCIDVAGSIFGHPLLGAEELVALWASVLLAFSLPSAHLEKANVGVDLLYLKFPPKLKLINNIFVAIVSFVLFALLCWQCYLYAGALHASGEVSMTLQLPAYMLVYAISFAFLILTIIMFLEIFSHFRTGGK